MNFESNVLNWYEFEENAEILIIGKYTENINTIGKFSKIVILDKKANENIINENIEITNKIDEKTKFDYIIFYKLEEINKVKKFLKESGNAFFITNNKFGITYFAGAITEKNKIFHSIINEEENVYSKNQIENILKLSGYNNYSFYYPLPNYKNPNVIFSDNYLPSENTTKLMYNYLYEDGSTIVFDELKAMKQIVKNNYFTTFANSYIVVINDAKKEQSKFISYNNGRKEEYRLKTKIFNDYVKKEACTNKSIEHINNIGKYCTDMKNKGFNIIDYKENDYIYSKYMEEDTFDKKICELIKDNKKEEAYLLINKWYEEIKNKLTIGNPEEINELFKGIDEEKTNKMAIIKDGYIDVVFENTFYINEKFVFFDQEWFFENIPLEYILYRAIRNLFIYNEEVEMFLTKKEILEKFSIAEYERDFDKVEKSIQEMIIDNEAKKTREKSLNKLIDINEVQLLHIQNEGYKENEIKRVEYIKNLEDDNRKKQEYIEALEERVSVLEKNSKGIFKRKG